MIFAIIGIILFVLIIVLISKKSFSPEAKGERGENYVARFLGDNIIGEQYVIHNLLFCNQTGQSCQIDHILINKYGIWVIETKNYIGYIYGEESQREWTQVVAYGNEKHKFYNPVKQNATHIYHLSKYLKVNNIFQNVVIFLQNADISHIISDKVYSIRDISFIKTQKTDICLSVKKMEEYYNKLLELKITSSISKEEHIANIYKKQEQLQNGICPRCGGKLVVRNGKNGSFFGCSNYPNCKFTKNID